MKVALELKNTHDLKAPWLASILYGPPKSGKTTLASTLGEAPLVIDFDDGVITLRDIGVNYYTPRTWEEVTELALLISNGKLRDKVQFDHVIWDSHTMFYSNIIIPAVLKLSGRTTLSQPEWGLCNDRCKLIYNSIIKARTDQRYHVSIICHEKIDKDETSGQILGGIATTPALREMLPAMVDELYYVKPAIQQTSQGKTAVYRVHTLTEGMFPAGTRAGRGRLLPTEVADMKAIYAKIVGDSKPKEAK